MKRWMHPTAVIAFVFLIALGAGPLQAGTSAGMTTGDLAVQIARAAGISLPGNDSPQAALESLGKAGINLGNDLKAPVTEKVLVQVGLAVGVTVVSSRPEAAVTPAVSGALIQLLKGELRNAAAASGQGGTDVIHASCQGRASRASRQAAPASPSNFNATAGPCEEPAS